MIDLSSSSKILADGYRIKDHTAFSFDASSSSTVIELAEGLWRLSLQQAMDATLSVYPAREGEPDCPYYMRNGVCGFGTNCRFNHPPIVKQGQSAFYTKDLDFPERLGQPECPHYLKTGACKFGPSCKFHHPHQKTMAVDVQTELNFLGLPMRLGEKDCTYYLRTGSCKYGMACKFHHPQPTGIGAFMPLPGCPIYAAAGFPTAAIPAPYQGFSSLPVARSAYISLPNVQEISNYTPLILSSHAVAAPSWTTYLGPVSPSPSEGQQETHFIYGEAQKQADSITRTSLLHSQAGQGGAQFPERPGQPDCHYYMKTGDCKFGIICKFHHPRDRIPPAVPCTLSVIGLPLRPGQPVCTFYMKYSICKFGPTCKFDHPVITLPYNPSVEPHIHISGAKYPGVATITTVATKSSSEVSHAIFKHPSIVMPSEAQASQDSEEVLSVPD